MPLKVLLLVATERGRQFAAKMFELLPDAQFTVCSFKETSHEPPFLDSIRELTQSHGHQFIQAHNTGEMPDADLLFAVSWRYMVPKEFYERMRLGAYVFHDSPLPRYRGFAPTVWAITNGETFWGVSLIKMAETVDEGNILDQLPIHIDKEDYINDVMSKVTAAYLVMLERILPDILSGNIKGIGQSKIDIEPTYCAKWTPNDARIDWNKSAQTVLNLIRATSHPYPGAFAYHDTTKMTIWRAHLGRHEYVGGIPGSVVGTNPLEILCGDGRTIVVDECDYSGDKLNLSTRLS